MLCLEAKDSGSRWPVPHWSTDPDETTFCVCVSMQASVSMNTPSLCFYTHANSWPNNLFLCTSLLLLLLLLFLFSKILFLPHSTPLPRSPPNPLSISAFSTLEGWTHITFFLGDLDLIKPSHKKIQKIGLKLLAHGFSPSSQICNIRRWDGNFGA